MRYISTETLDDMATAAQAIHDVALVLIQNCATKHHAYIESMVFQYLQQNFKFPTPQRQEDAKACVRNMLKFLLDGDKPKQYTVAELFNVLSTCELLPDLELQKTITNQADYRMRLTTFLLKEGLHYDIPIWQPVHTIDTQNLAGVTSLPLQLEYEILDKPASQQAIMAAAVKVIDRIETNVRRSIIRNKDRHTSCLHTAAYPNQLYIHAILYAKDKLMEKQFYGPYLAIVGAGVSTHLDDDYNSNMTVRDALLTDNQFNVKEIMYHEEVPPNSIVMVQLTPNVVRLIKAAPPRVVSLPDNRLCVYGIITPQVRNWVNRMGIVEVSLVD